MYTADMEPEDRKKYFGAICLTETPLNEVHCLLEIKGRSVNLEPYGLVFLKDKFVKRGVDPVLYINNNNGEKAKVMKALCSLIKSEPDAAAHVLPLLAIFGDRLTPPGAIEAEGEVDFRWEREWRYLPVKGPLVFSEEDVFMGLCTHDKIPQFDKLWKPIEFFDPRRNMKWYATKLIKARQRLDLKDSVV